MQLHFIKAVARFYFAMQARIIPQQDLTLSPRTALFVHGLLFLAAILPFWSITWPPLVDYLNHLARMHILHEYAHSPALQQNYQIRWQVTPYLAMEAVVLPLLHIVDLATAGKIFITLAFLLTAAGVVGLQLVIFKKINVFSFLVYPFLYSLNLGWGFVPFVFSIGCMLCLFCGFLHVSRRGYLLQIVYLSLAATILFFSHLIVMGIFGLLVASAATAETRWFSRAFFQRGLRLLPAFLPVAALWTLVPTAPFSTGVTEGWLDPLKLAVFLFNASYVTEVAVTSALLFALYIGWREKLLLTGSPVLQRCLVVTGVLALCLPERFLNIGLFGMRLPYVWCLLLIAGIAFRPGVAQSRNLWLVFGVLAGILLMRHFMIAENLMACDAKLREFQKATHVLPRGTTLTAVYDMKNVDSCGNIHWLEHVNTIAVIERDVFVPNLFMKTYPVLPAPRHDDPGYVAVLPPQIDDFFPSGKKYHKQPEKMRNWRQNFAYIAYFYFTRPKPIPDTVEVYRGSYFSILKVTPQHAD